MTSANTGKDQTAKIKVIGIGGAGGNAVNNMIEAELNGVQFIVANTDAQALDISKAPVKLQIGQKLTEGLGAGANPQVGNEAAQESEDAIRESLKDSHMVFITAGFGGGTGTGAAPVVAKICKDLDALTVAVITKPFSFEGKKREKIAYDGIEDMRQVADTVITIPNDRLRGLAGKNARMLDMFKKADEILLHSVKGITDLIMMPGLVNLDFADVSTTMSKAGMAIMGIGSANGENRAIQAAQNAISHPLLEDVSIKGAKGVLMNITCTSDLTMEEMTEASDCIYSEVGEDAEIIWGQTFDESLGDEMRVTVIATGIGGAQEAKKFDQTISPINLINDAFGDDERRTKLKPPVHPQADKTKAIDYDDPTYMRRREAVEETVRPLHDINRTDKYDSIAFDNNDLDVPTFLRRKAN